MFRVEAFNKINDLQRSAGPLQFSLNEMIKGKQFYGHGESVFLVR